MGNSNYKNENIETKYFNNMRKNQFLKGKNGILRLEKYFIELKDRELRDREVKIKRKIQELFSKSIIVSIDDMDKFEQKEMKTIRPIKNTWYDWFINYIPDTIRKGAGAFKDKIVSLFETNTPKQAVYERRKILNKSKIQKQSEENITNRIRNLFILKKEIKIE